jgi:hypothetical protein
MIGASGHPARRFLSAEGAVTSENGIGGDESQISHETH